MTWLIQSVVLLWYAEEGQFLEQVKREPTFAQMLWTLRGDLLAHWLSKSANEAELSAKQHWLVVYFATAVEWKGLK